MVIFVRASAKIPQKFYVKLVAVLVDLGILKDVVTACNYSHSVGIDLL